MSGRAAAAAGAASDTARQWAGHGVELAGIIAGLRECWDGHCATITLAQLEAVAARIAELGIDLDHLAEVLGCEGEELERAVATGTDVAAADAALLARLRYARPVEEARAVLQGPALPGATVGPLPAVPELAAGVDARTVATTWHGLSPVQREAFLAAHPGIEDRSGLPPSARDTVNRDQLADTIAGRPGAPVTDPERTLALAEHLAAHPDTRLLALDTAGRGTVASGDPGAADRVLTFVPGTGSSMAGLADATADAAALCAATAQDKCVAVTFLDQDAPESVPVAALDTGRAAEAAPRLQDLQSALRDAAGEGAELDVVGYSYGGVLAGAAATGPGGLAADRLLFLAAPGAVADHVSELQLTGPDGVARPGDGESVAALAERWDPVPWWEITAIHGEGPMDADFGADRRTVDSVDSPPDLANTHTGYFDPDGVALPEIGRILAGRP